MSSLNFFELSFFYNDGKGDEFDWRVRAFVRDVVFCTLKETEKFSKGDFIGSCFS